MSVCVCAFKNKARSACRRTVGRLLLCSLLKILISDGSEEARVGDYWGATCPCHPAVPSTHLSQGVDVVLQGKQGQIDDA